MNLEHFKTIIEKEKERRRKKAKALYRLARKFGFSSVESRYLCQTSEENIKKLAEEKKQKEEEGV